MDAHRWWTFAVTVCLGCAAPGPNMLKMMTTGIAHGWRRTCFTMAGCYLAVLTLIGASVVGVGAVLSASPKAFTALCFAGAAYLFYMGIQSWRMPGAAVLDAGVPASAQRGPAGSLFREGFFVGISNPKALLFAAAFFPQFIDPSRPNVPQLFILLATFSILELGWYMIYALGGQKLAASLRRPEIRNVLNRLVGSVFTVFGLSLIVSRL